MASFVSLQEAVAANTRDGDIVALEGFTHLIPYAAGHELIRQQRRGLTLVRMTPDIIYDQLIGMGAAEKLIFSTFILASASFCSQWRLSSAPRS